MIYADNAATTMPSSKAVTAMYSVIDDYGNPSSIHSMGQEARIKLDKARKTVAHCLGAKPEEIIFTSGGTEADNMAILTALAWGTKHRGTHIVTTAIEHHAILHTLERMEGSFEYTIVGVDESGVVDPAEIEQAIRPDTCLVSVMYVNNEIGTLQPISEIGAICRRRGVMFHTDAVQAVGNLPIDVAEENIDLLSLSGHKFHGPKGVGALYCRKDIPLYPIITGGAQEKGKRAGTENVPGIVGMAAALAEALDTTENKAKHVTAMRDKLIGGLSAIPGAHLNGHPTKRAPGIVSFCFEKAEGESMVLLLDEKGICASAGSACSSGSLAPSHVLTAIGRSEELAFCGLRLSLSDYNTEEEVDVILEAVKEVTAYLRTLSGKGEHDDSDGE